MRFLTLSPDVSRLPILPKTNKTGVAQVIVRCPFQEFELAHVHRIQPLALFHLFGRQSNAPPPGSRFRQIGERALSGFEPLESTKQLVAG